MKLCVGSLTALLVSQTRGLGGDICCSVEEVDTGGDQAEVESVEAMVS